MKKIWSLVASVGLVLGITGCGATTQPTPNISNSANPAPEAGDLVFVSLPNEEDERWTRDGAELRRVITEAGYKVDLSFAENKIDRQNTEIENAITKGAKIMVIAAKNGTSLVSSVDKARAAGIKVIAYDRLIMDTSAVDYYLSFKLETIGQAQAQYIIDKLGLAKGEKGPFNVELFSGSSDDNNAKFYFRGAWELLQPYFANGTLVSPSNRVNENFSAEQWQSISIDSWKLENAQKEMEIRLSKYDEGRTALHAVLSPSDAISQGVINALRDSSFSQWKPGSEQWPWITGQDATNYALYNINQNLQGQTVWKDTRELANKTAEVCIQILEGETVSTDSSMNNNVLDVPSVFLDSVPITKTGESDAPGTQPVQFVIDSGFTTAEQLKQY
ncbi:MAG: sugar-binding protein [Bifidobacteriaceae bacterium]|jgi:putative multiple sugar transport system substrate-binding protein|nr:sugar-binding protein [Bifidobacteriaceae bacterium]